MSASPPPVRAARARCRAARAWLRYRIPGRARACKNLRRGSSLLAATYTTAPRAASAIDSSKTIRSFVPLRAELLRDAIEGPRELLAQRFGRDLQLLGQVAPFAPQ